MSKLMTRPTSHKRPHTTKEDLLAVGDHSTGLVTIYNLLTLEWYTITPSQSVVSSLTFSPAGRSLLITYGHVPKNETVFVHHLDRKQTKNLPGSAPAVWINDSSIIMVRDNKVLLRYDIEEKSEQTLHKSFSPIRHIASDGKVVVYAGSEDETAPEKQLTEIQFSRIDGFNHEIFARMNCPLEQLEIFNSMLFVATSWNGSASDTRRLRIFDLGGELISEFAYDSGHGHGYPKYAHLKSRDATFISTTGVNGYVPFVDISKRRRVTINLDDNDKIKSARETWISVQLNEGEKGHLYLSLLSHEGAFALYEIEDIK